MRKCYLFLMMLMVHLITGGNAFAQTDAEYNAAMAAITDGGFYYITTEVDEVTYYLTKDGLLTDDTEDPNLGQFCFKKNTASGFYKSAGFELESGSGNFFSNPLNDSYTNDIITDTQLNLFSDARDGWEVQVFFLNADGKYAVRATNCTPASSGWNHVGSSFWTVAIGDSHPYPTYEYEPQFIWNLVSVSVVTADPLTLTSPNGRLVLETNVDDTGKAWYTVSIDGQALISKSLLGLEGRSSFPGGIVLSAATDIDETYALPHGKQATFRDCCRELLVTCAGTTDSKNLDVRFRIYDDAVCFRYEMAKTGGLTAFKGENTEFTFPNINQVLALEYNYAYEWYYNQRKWADMTNERGYNEPVLVQTGKNNICVLISEAAHYAETAGNAIVRGEVENQFKLRPADRDGFVSSTPISYSNDTWHTPWRVMIIGKPAEIAESIVIPNLNPPSTFDDWSWIRPGRVAWNWAEENHNNARDINVAKRYVDMAQHLGWEYVLIDDGWEGNIRLEDFVPYANERGVDVMVWYNNNHFSSTYSSCLTEFRRLARLGVKGVKIDFFDSDAKNVIAKYEVLLRAAAKAKIMIDFHGCTRPTGWERTYPNLMTMEAVLGGEYLLDQPHMNQADHSANLVVGRNVLGAMDFTPTKLAQSTGSLKTHTNTTENPFTTWSYQLALRTLFESSFQCLIDCPDNIIDSPIEPALRLIPSTWDETRCLEVSPDNYATLARRNGDEWYVATVSKKSRTPRIKLDFLPEGETYYAYIYSDGACQFDVNFQKREVTSKSSLSISVKPNGGATVILSRNPNLPYPHHTIYEAETKTTGGAIAVSAHCSGGKYRRPNSTNGSITFRSIKVEADGEYAVTLFYMLDSSTEAYVQVGNGDKQYLQLHARDDYDERKGLFIGMKTVYVQLQKGTNTITYGHDGDLPPALDRISVTPTRATAEIIDGIIGTEARQPDFNASSLTLEQGAIVCRTTDGGTLSLYSTNGHLLERHTVAAGQAIIRPVAKGVAVASLNMGSRAVTRKFLIE